MYLAHHELESLLIDYLVPNGYIVYIGDTVYVYIVHTCYIVYIMFYSND